MIIGNFSSCIIWSFCCWNLNLNSIRSLAKVRFIKYFWSVIAFVCGKMCLVIYFVATPVLGFEERPLGKSVWTCEKKHFAGRHHSHSFSAPNLTKIFYGVKGRKRKTWSINWAHSVPLPMWGRAHHCKFDERSQLNNSHNKLHKRKLRERCIFTHLFSLSFFPIQLWVSVQTSDRGNFKETYFLLVV